METYDLAEAAQRSGVEVDELARLVELGVLTPDAENRFTPGHLRRAGLVLSLTAAGIPVEGLGAAIRRGQVSLDFLDAPAFERFSALSGVTFAQMAERTGVWSSCSCSSAKLPDRSRRFPTIAFVTRSSPTPN